MNEFVSGLKRVYHCPAIPSAEEWYKAFEQLEDNLKTCKINTNHIYYDGAKECPWCKVENTMNRNRIFRNPFGTITDDNSLERVENTFINALDDLHVLQIYF